MRLRANAKINLTLDIKKKRADGYHNLHSVMQAVSVYDEIDIQRAEKISVWYSDIGNQSQDDICFKAAENFFKASRISGGADIKIEKNIPVLAGMGGSSSDAAAVILALDKMYDTNLSINQLIAIGKSVGADVPFCMLGGTKEVSGIGEIIAPLKAIPDCAFLIVMMGKKKSTGDMFSQLDSIERNSESTYKMIEAINKEDIKDIADCLSNDFEMVFDISRERELLSELLPLGICLSGSGPATFALFENREKAQAACESLKAKGIKALIALPQEKGVIFE